MSVEGASQEPSHGPVYGRTIRSSKATNAGAVAKATGSSRDALNAAHDPSHNAQSVVHRPATAALHGTTILLAVLASAIFVFTDNDSRRSVGAMLFQLVLEAAVMIGAAMVVRRNDLFHRSAAFVMPVLVVVTIVAMIWEPVKRMLLDTGRPLEMMIMNSQKALMLAAAAAGCWPRYQRLSIVIGTALAIFCAAITTDQRVQWMIAIFGFAAVSWLVASHWETLRTRLRAEESGRLPMRWLIIGPAIPLLLLLVTAAGGRSTIQSLRGFLPGSGGEDQFDPNSRGGINDGDALVAGAEQIQSFAPIEDAPFAEDDKPSLYDVVNDQFEEPVKKNRSAERAIALGPEMMAELMAKMARSKEAGREFSTHRKSGQKNKPRPKDIDSRALFYLAGRTPMHLRMEVYDIFDGVDWIAEIEELDQPKGLFLSKLANKTWIRLPNQSTEVEVHSPAESHAVKVINLRSPVIPAPLELRAVHIDKLEDVTMFGWHSPSILRMTRKSLPELTSINLLTQCVHRDELVDHPDLNFQGMGISRRTQLPAIPQMEQVKQLANQWTEGIPRGYLQAEAICNRLRTDYTLDRAATAPEDHAFPIGHFLFESKRGPDYQFATAATVLLRSLGYSARMVSGFYASPERFDVRKRQTPVLSKDVHFWCEIYAGSGTWVTMEPTPGYETLAPPPTLWSRLINVFLTAARGIVRHWAISFLVIASLIVVWWRRDDVADFSLTLVHPFFGAQTSRSDLLRTGRLIDWRLRRTGLTRPEGVTLTRWLRQPVIMASCDALPEFVRLSEVAAFGSEKQVQTLDRNQVVECCRQIRSRLNLRSCRQLRRSVDQTRQQETVGSSSSFPPSRGESGRLIMRGVLP